MSQTSFTIAARFAGPPRSGNGGYTAGLVAEHVSPGQPVTVTLRRPPPLEVALLLARDGLTTRLLDGDAVVAEASEAAFSGDPVEAVAVEVAREAQASYRGFVEHPFPTCFACGPARDDGLRLAPGPVAPGRTACVWVPDASLVAEEGAEVAAVRFAWAAMDCPGGWVSDLDARPLVLGRMTAVCDEAPIIGRAHVVVAALVSEEGRKTFTASTLYDDDGRVLGRAEHTWIAIDPATFSG
jgi:hypothetical protein